MAKKKKKKKILFHSNYSRALTGFGKNCRHILSHLYATGKYEIIEACNGFPKNAPQLSKLPWKCVGTLPADPQKIAQLNKDPQLARSAGYGGETIDDLVKEIRPDIYIGVEDIWGFNGYWTKKWWNKVSCMIWTTLDSEPILPLAIEAAPKVKNYYVWASFAEREMHKLGFDHVKTLRGSLYADHFYKLPDKTVGAIREKYKIDTNCFLIGFVFRNQLRKSVPNLLDGYEEFLKRHPDSNAKLLLHTHWGEGWDIPRLLKEKDIDPLNILTTYYCPACRQYEIKPFSGQKQNCRFCGTKESQNTTHVQAGVSEEQLNEIYNLMDVYCHPFTSGGQEIPVQEAKLTELITLVTNYSCGEDSCTPEGGGFPLEWAEYREPGTQFIKASTYPSSIARQLSKVYKMTPTKRAKLGVKARQFVVDNYSTAVIGAQLEKIINKMPFCDWDFDFTEKPRDPDYIPPSIKDDTVWLIDIYDHILNMEVDKDDEGHRHWMNELSQGRTRDFILGYFKKVATKENSEINKAPLLDLLDGDPQDRIAVVMPQSAGDVLMINSLLANLKELYPSHDIYIVTSPKFFPLIEDNPHVHKMIEYVPDSIYEHLDYLEGCRRICEEAPSGYFDLAFLPHLGTQKSMAYTHNGKDKTQFKLRDHAR